MTRVDGLKFYKNFFFLMIPMALKELVAALVNLLDTVMLGELGTDVIAAAGIANQWYFLFAVFVFGTCGGAGVFAAQYWGAGNLPKVRKVLGINLILVTILSLVFILISSFAPETIIRIFRKDTSVVELGSKYLRLVCISYLFSGVTSAYDISLCCSENVNIPFISRFIGLFVNAFFNWVLIYGKLGAPALGIEGAAIATIIARGTELLIILATIYGKKLVQAAKISELLTIPKDMIGGYLKASIPVALNESAWALGTVSYSWVFSQISTEAMVVITIVQNIERLLLVFFHGGGNAAGIMIGKLVGADETDKAYEISKKLGIMNTVFALCISTLFIFLRPLALLPYNVGPEVHRSALNLLFMMAIIMNVKSLTFFFIVGVFRNGGDPKHAAMIDISSMWLVGVPLAMLAGLVFKLPLEIIYLATMGEEFIKLALSLYWFASKKWIKNLVK